MSTETDFADALARLRTILAQSGRTLLDPEMRLVDAAISEREGLRFELDRLQHPDGRRLEEIVDPEADLGAKRTAWATLRLTVHDDWRQRLAGVDGMKATDRLALELGQRLAGCPAWTITDVRVGRS